MSTFLAACASQNTTELTSEELHTTLDRLATRDNICGVVIAVIKNRKIDSIDSATGCQPALSLNGDSIFQAASLGTTVFSFAVFKLVEQGKLELDAPVIKYIPQGHWHRPRPFEINSPFKDDLVTDPRIQAVTIRMILNHTSGLPNWTQGPLRFESTPGKNGNNRDKAMYCCGVLSRPLPVSGSTNLWLRKYSKPLGMNHSNYVWDPRFERNIIAGTATNGSPIKPRYFKTPIAAATLYTSAENYGKFVVAVLNNNYFLKKITESGVTVDPSLNLSWGIERSEGDLFIWH